LVSSTWEKKPQVYTTGPVVWGWFAEFLRARSICIRRRGEFKQANRGLILRQCGRHADVTFQDPPIGLKRMQVWIDCALSIEHGKAFKALAIAGYAVLSPHASKGKQCLPFNFDLENAHRFQRWGSDAIGYINVVSNISPAVN
jgi:hypothetical protein